MEPTLTPHPDEIKRFLQSKLFVFQPDDGNFLQGFHSYGPIGLKIKNFIIREWLNIFVQDNVFEIETPTVNSREMLTRSSHTKMFNDPIITVKRKGIDEVFRADHFIEEQCEKYNLELPTFSSLEEMSEYILLNNLLEEPFEITNQNLMLETQRGFMRPELAQGIFVEFSKLFQLYGKQLPFGIAQVGKSYRNEINPSPFKRLREFTQAELEYFIDESDTNYDYENLDNDILPFLSREDKCVTLLTMHEACKRFQLNYHIAYFICKLSKFVKRLGLLDLETFRFRQHMRNEMAHYAKDCWDLEILCEGKWLECAGLANRSNYDLTCHGIKPIKSRDGKLFIPHVIEPSVGIDRMFYAMMLHKIKGRADAPTRLVLTTSRESSLYDVMVAQLSKHDCFTPFVQQILKELESKSIKCFCDYSTTSIGKRYTRGDEIGIPYAITVDFDTLTTNTVTIRDRDTTKQIRIKIKNLVIILKALREGRDFDLVKVLEPIEPIEPVEPVEPIELIEPIEPVEPIEPAVGPSSPEEFAAQRKLNKVVLFFCCIGFVSYLLSN